MTASRATYSFTLPSIEDDTTLDCRVYHPQGLESRILDTVPRVKGAVVAHPYAPLGGSYDDPVVLTVTQALLDQAIVVVTFNFRGARSSPGRGSWSGRGEIEDFVSLAGFMVWYLQSLIKDGGGLAVEAGTAAADPLDLLLAGYSYGALVLARSPEVSAIAQRLQDAEPGTAGAEIILRANALAKQTFQALDVRTESSRGRSSTGGMSDLDAPRPKLSPVTMGGEETSPAERRRSRDSRRSTDLIRRSVEVPTRIKHRFRKLSDDKAIKTRLQSASPQLSNHFAKTGPRVMVRYLVISPVLLPIPFTTVLAPVGVPSLPFGHRRPSSDDNAAGAIFTRHPTLVLFGTKDTFTSDKQLRLWADKLQKASKVNDFRWKQIRDVGHFWQEEGALSRLQDVVGSWVRLQGVGYHALATAENVLSVK